MPAIDIIDANDPSPFKVTVHRGDTREMLS
jgi:hypothetical protein